MKIHNLIISLGISFFFFASCKSKIENAQTKTIDSLIIALENAEESIENIDFEKLEKSAKIAKENLEKIKPLIDDSLSRDKVFLMSNYAIVSGEEGEEAEGHHNSEDYEEVREKYIEKELALCKKQLVNLKNDFSKGDMENSSFQKYYDIEKEKAFQILLFVQKETKVSAYRQELFDSLHPLITKFMDSLETVSIKK